MCLLGHDEMRRGVGESWVIPEGDIIVWRRHIHADPELSYQEYRTADFVAEKLRGFPGIEITRPTATSVVGVLHGDLEGKTMALRSDMDALPVIKRAEEIIKGICAGYGVGYDIEWGPSYAVVNNDPELADIAYTAAAKALGPGNVSWAPASLVGEDFFAYTQQIPGCFLFLGGGTADDGLPFPNHHPRFNFLETSLAAGTRTEVQLVRDMITPDSYAPSAG